jgi:2-polyprenyl-6-methoxyphenol hydroxylase-like FAD-dependent oxidoreductase
MGLVPRIRELGYAVREVRFVDRRGRKAGGFGVDVFRRLTDGRFTSLRRSDLSRTLFERLGGGVETLFGDSIASIEEVGDGVRLGFDRASERKVDLVVGADGLHSRVRALAFGAEAEFEVPLGYHVAAFEARGYRPRDDLLYVTHGVPGRQVSRFTMREDRTLFLFVFRDEFAPGEPSTDEERKAAVARAFRGIGWECPRILAAMQEAGGIYYDRVSQIRMNRWASGRTVLVGDAAACVSLLAGEGTGLAMAEAYVLAGELAAGGDPAAAFARYEARMRPFLARKQASAAKFASSFAPRTALGIIIRNFVTRLLRAPFVADYFIGRDLRDDVDLPDYAFSKA